MDIHFKQNNGPVDLAIEALMDLVDRCCDGVGIRHRDIIREMILAAIKAGLEDGDRADLLLMNSTLKEMRFTTKVFSKYRHVRKVSVFGSARTQPREPIYSTARDLGKALANGGYMVITGGGPGIMHAVNEGAGPDHSFGINIRLPFEQKSNPIVHGNPKSITYKYFFNRKVAFLKEAHAIVLFPGGFGTLDEAMEMLTLMQTGKTQPIPLILMDNPQRTYWSKWLHFLEKELLAQGYIGKNDFDLFQRVDSVEEILKTIAQFYFRYHSLRYVSGRLVIRMVSALDERAVQSLKTQFQDILTPGGDMVLSGPLEEESDEPRLAALPRLVVDFNRYDFGRLKNLIDAINHA